MRKPRYREVKGLAQGYTAVMSQHGDLNAGRAAPELFPCTPLEQPGSMEVRVISSSTSVLIQTEGSPEKPALGHLSLPFISNLL